MTLAPNSYNAASTAIHVLQGAALLALGLAELFPAGKRGREHGMAAALLLVLSAAGAGAAILHFLGGWSLKDAVIALNVKKSFYIFVAFACYYASAGLSRLMYLASDEKKALWDHISLVFLTAAGALYFTLGHRVNEEAAGAVGALNAAIGAALLAAILAKVLHGYFKRTAFRVAWAVLLLAAAAQLLAYRENSKAFEYRMVTIEAGPELKPAGALVPVQVPAQVSGSILLSPDGPRPQERNAKSAHKERSRD